MKSQIQTKWVLFTTVYRTPSDFPTISRTDSQCPFLADVVRVAHQFIDPVYIDATGVAKRWLDWNGCNYLLTYDEEGIISVVDLDSKHLEVSTGTYKVLVWERHNITAEAA